MKVFYLSEIDVVINVDSEEEINRFETDETAEEIPLEIFEGLERYASSENTRTIDGVWVFSQDMTELLSEAREVKIDILNTQADRYVLELTKAQYPDFERETFAMQKAEAQAWATDNSAPTPRVDILAANRGVDREILLQKILEKVEAFEIIAMTVAGQRQKYEDQIKAATTVAELEAIAFVFTTGA